MRGHQVQFDMLFLTTEPTSGLRADGEGVERERHSKPADFRPKKKQLHDANSCQSNTVRVGIRKSVSFHRFLSISLRQDFT